MFLTGSVLFFYKIFCRWSLSASATWTSAENVLVSSYHISPAIWGTSGTAIGRIGVIAHETGHFLGLPDLYDTDTSAGEGIGNWGLMANSWGFGGNQYYPPHLSAWSKIFLGYVTPTVISSSGTYVVPASALTPTIFKITQNYASGEYLLIENRQPVDFDSNMGSTNGGLCIFHIDDTTGYNTEGYPGQAGWPTNGYHYRVSVLQADGLYELEKGSNRGNVADLWRAGGKYLLAPSTVPDTNGYKGGAIVNTNITINVLSTTQMNMTIRVDFGAVPCSNMGVTCPTGTVLSSTAQCIPGTNCDSNTCCATFCSISSNLGLSCNDGNVNTINDVCTSSGVCAGVAATCGNTGVTCPQNYVRVDNTLCTPGSTCNSNTCCVTFCSVASNLGLSCDDGNSNTVNDVCTSDGQCTGAPFCSVASNNGLACNDNNANTINDVCVSGTCTGVAATCGNVAFTCPTNYVRLDSQLCSPGSTCNTNTCCAAFCSIASNNGLTCNDGNANTINDVCVSGTCQGTATTCQNTGVTCASGQTLLSKTCTVGSTCTTSNCCVGSLVVKSISVSGVTVGNKLKYRTVVTVTNSLGTTLSNVAVQGTFSQSNGWTESTSGTTVTGGTATITTVSQWSKTTAVNKTTKFCVSGLSLTGYQYTPGTVTCAFVV